MSEETLASVRLLGIPVRVWQEASAHQEAIQRELEIMRMSESPDSVPNRLLELFERLGAQFGDAGDPTWEQLRVAAGRGDETADLTFRLPASVGPAARDLRSMLAEVDRFTREGDHLITLTTPPEYVLFRDWFLGEFTRQVDSGEEPMRWADFRAQFDVPPGHEPPSGASGSGSETIAFAGSLDLATVGELREQIQATRARDVGEILVDLTNVGFVDSVGIGLLVTTYQRLLDEGVAMRLIAPPRLKELLRLTGLVDLLQPEDPAAS